MRHFKLPSNSFFAAAIGTMVEYYDYALFTLFLPITAPLFFPASTAYDSLVKGFYVLLIPMVARPLGGIFFGYLGDYFGRRVALLSSMYGIAFATLLIGFTPSFATFGLLSTMIIIFAKTVQVFCFGGEYNGAGIYVIEHAKEKNEAFIGSLLTALMLLGSFFASLIGIILTFSFMPQWSWRIAFLIGGIIGIIGICSRKNLLETPHFRAADENKENLKTLITRYPSALVASIFIGGFATIPFTTVLTFLTPVLMTKGFFTKQQFMLIQSLLILIGTVSVLFAGKMADSKSSPLKVMRLGALLLTVLSFPLLYWVDKGSFIAFITASAILIIINELLLGPSNAFLKNLFPMQFRYRGSSFGFTLGMSLLGGLTPIIENYLYQSTGHFSAIAFWLIFLGLGTWFSLTIAYNRKTSLSLSQGKLSTVG